MIEVHPDFTYGENEELATCPIAAVVLYMSKNPAVAVMFDKLAEKKELSDDDIQTMLRACPDMAKTQGGGAYVLWHSVRGKAGPEVHSLMLLPHSLTAIREPRSGSRAAGNNTRTSMALAG